MKQLIQNITTSISLPRALARRLVLLLAILLVGVGQAWGARFAKVVVNSEPSVGGYVYASTGQGGPDFSGQKSKDDAYNDDWSLRPRKSFDFYLSAQANSGYVFRGWSTNSNSNSTSSTTATKYKVTVNVPSANTSLNPATDTYFAIFARMASDVSSWNAGSVNVESSVTKTITISHAHADKISAKLTGSSDFSINKTTIVNSSVAADTETIIVTFRPTSAGNKSATLEISSAYGGLSKITISLSGTGVLYENTLKFSAGKKTMLVEDYTSLSSSDQNSNGTIIYSIIDNAYSTSIYDSNYKVISQSGNTITARNAGTATLRITQEATYKFAGKTIDIDFTVDKHNQTLSWADCIDDDYLLVNETRTHVATASSGLAVSYSSSNAGVLSVSSGGQMKGESVGNDITITASQAGNYKYKPAESLSCIYDVRAKLVPVFTPNPSPDQEPSTYNIKVDDAIVFSLTNVSSIASGNFTFSATKDNGNDVVSCSRVADVLTVRAIHEGTTTLTLNQAETFSAPYISALSATYTINVTKYNNTLVATLSDNELLVDETATISFTKQNNVNTAIDVTISNEMLTNAALSREINGVKPVITYSNGVITAQNAGTARITFSQPATVKYTASTVYGFDITVNKIGNNLSTSVSATSILVDGTSSASFTGQNNAGTINVNISNESLTNAALSREINGVKPVITYSNGIITGKNAGTARITFSQPETYKYLEYSQYFDITVTKCTNTIKVNNSTAYVANLNLSSSQAVTIMSDNSLSSPVVYAGTNAAVAIIPNISAVATYVGTGAGGTIYSTFNDNGPATFSVRQEEDYKYLEGNASITVNVSKLTPTAGINCYLRTFDCDRDHEVYHYWAFGDHDNRYELTWDNPLNNVSTVVFSAKRQTAGTGNLAIYQLVNGNWQYVDEIGSSLTDSYKDFSRQLDPTCTGIQFRDASGTLAKYVKCVKVKKLPYLLVSPTSLDFGKTILNVPVATRTFDIEWSGGNTGDVHIVSSDPTHFTVNQPTISHSNDCNNATVTVTYNPVDIGTHTAIITIYDKGRVREVTVTGTTQPQYDLVVSGQNKSIQVEDDLNLSDIISCSYEGNYSVVPADPTHGEGTSPFYFTINIDNITGNQDNCKVPNAVVTYDAVTKKFHACNAGKVTITFTQTDENPAVHAGMKVGGVHRDNVSYTITVSKYDPTFTWTLPNAEWASQYKFSNYFSSDNEATPWSAVSNTDIAVYRSSTDSIYTNYRSGNATFTVTQEENYYWNRKDSTVTTNVQHGVESTCYLYESEVNKDIRVWDFVQATWQDTAVAGKVIFDLKRGSLDGLGVVSLKVNQFVNGAQSQVGGDINSQSRDSWNTYKRDLNVYATGVSFDNLGKVIGDGLDYSNHLKNVKVTRVSWIKASSYDIILPPIGKQGHSEATVTVYWSGVEPLRIEKRTNNPHFEVSPDAYFVQTPCTSGFSVLTFAYHSDEPGNETETIVIYDHAHSLEITLHGTTENKEMQEIVWNQSFNPILALGGTIDADSLLTAYATNRQGARTNQPITYTVGNTSIATIENGNHLHITNIGRTTITATVAGNGYYSGAAKTLILNVLDGTGCGSLAFSNESEVTLFTITSDDALAVTRPAEDLYFEAKRDWIAFLNPAAQHVKMRYKVAGDNNWRTQDENGVEIETGALNSDWGSYGPFRLPENTEGIQFYTEFGAYFSQHVRNVYITQRSYLRKDKVALMANIMVNTLTEVGKFTVEYSDKPTLIVENKCSNVKLFVDNPAPNECGSAGKYTYTVSCFSDTIGIIKDTVTVTSGLDDKLSVPVTIYVGIDGEFFFDNGIDHDITHTDWNVTQYWRKDNVYDHGRIPTMASLTTIEGPTVIDYDAYAYKMTITGSGKVTIAPNGSLKVGAGGIHGATMSNLILEADNTGQTGILRLYPGIADEKIPDALVQIYTTAYWDRENGKKAVWQYIGTPVRNPDTNEHIFYQCWLYQYNQSLDKWKNAGNWGHMVPFQAYAFTRDKKSSGPLTGFGGQLNTLSIQNVDLTYIDKDHCENHLANSWTAPIYLKQFKPSDFQNVDPIIYCYTIEGKGLAKEIAVYTSDYTGNDILPAMQGFFVKARSNENPQLLLDYERLVWKNETSKNAPLRAPSRMNEEESDLSARICIQMTSADMVTDRIYLLEKDGEGFSPDYEVGYDAPKYFVDGLPCIYTYETSGPHLAVSATDDVVGTYLAINTGASQDYTLTFSKVIGEGLGLRDLVTNTIVPITEGMQYAFTAPANSSPMLRFVVVEHEETPEWNNNNGGTSLEDVGGEFKIWQSGEILSVIGAGSHASLRIYDAAGKLILSEFFNEATAISLTALPTGVYMVQVNDKTEKVLR